MILSKSQCDKFKSDPSINPLTGRTIHQGKITYIKLTKACNTEDKIKTPIKSIKINRIPPMGPMIDWQFNTETPDDEENNLIEFHDFIDEIIENKHKYKFTKMEIDDYIDIITIGKNYFKNEKDYFEAFSELLEKLNQIKRTSKLINDIPKPTTIAHMQIRPSKMYIRGRVLRCFQLWKSAYDSINGALLTQKISTHVSKLQMKNVLEQKKYLDYLIKHKIFSHDDIYKNTFPNDKVYNELKDKYEEYVVLYKKLKGKSP
jgi:hypothetical protein